MNNVQKVNFKNLMIIIRMSVERNGKNKDKKIKFYKDPEIKKIQDEMVLKVNNKNQSEQIN